MVEIPPAPPSEACCRQGCLNAVAENPAIQQQARELQQSLSHATRDQKKQLQLICLRDWQTKQGGWRSHSAWGLPLCAEAVRSCLSLSKKEFTSLVKDREAGRIAPSAKLQSTQRQRTESAHASRAADTLLQWVYESLAEGLVEGGQLRNAKEQPARAKPPTVVVPANLIAGGAQEPPVDAQDVRWLAPHTTVAEMYQTAKLFLPDEQCSYPTFARQYVLKWQQKLRARCESQHSKCVMCERFKEYRRQCHTKADQERVAEEYGAHLRAVMEDRRVDCQLNLRALQTKDLLSEERSGLLSMCIDAMDAAKFRCPRNISASKEFQALWRPELHLVGCLSIGLIEEYFLSDPDMPKNSSYICHLVAHALDECARHLAQAGKAMPAHFRLHSDNATGEAKNQTLMRFASYLVATEKFETVSLTQFRVEEPGDGEPTDKGKQKKKQRSKDEERANSLRVQEEEAKPEEAQEEQKEEAELRDRNKAWYFNKMLKTMPEEITKLYHSKDVSRSEKTRLVNNTVCKDAAGHYTLNLENPVLQGLSEQHTVLTGKEKSKGYPRSLMISKVGARWPCSPPLSGERSMWSRRREWSSICSTRLRSAERRRTVKVSRIEDRPWGWRIRRSRWRWQASSRTSSRSSVACLF